MTDIAALKAHNLSRWNKMQIPQRFLHELDSVSSRLIAAKARYQAVEAKTNVPWFIIAVIHEREASQSWKANLAQGDPWDRVSIHVPRGQGPFKSWEDAAVNALKGDHLTTWGDWTPGGATTALEKYNGLGYANHGIPSPYVWASTDQYHSGKYIADGHFDPNAIDHQMGAAALMGRMMVADSTIKFAA